LKLSDPNFVYRSLKICKDCYAGVKEFLDESKVAALEHNQDSSEDVEESVASPELQKTKAS
jgi:hypothetical protein